MSILFDVSEALDPFREAAMEALDEVNVEKEINEAIANQLSSVIDYIEGVETDDYTEEDLMEISKAGFFLQTIPQGSDPNNPVDVLYGELFEAIVQGIIVHRHPDQKPIRCFTLRGNLLEVLCDE